MTTVDEAATVSAKLSASTDSHFSFFLSTLPYPRITRPISRAREDNEAVSDPADKGGSEPRG
jgi:hypothetical protein